MLAGEGLRSASGATSWCAALRGTLLAPLNLTRTFCHRNEIPPALAAQHLAAVHKADPCAQPARRQPAGVPAVATYDFVETGGPTDFAWGAADAAGSVISSASDMGAVLSLVLGDTTSELLAPHVLEQMISGQMITPPRWLHACGVAMPPAGRSARAE